MNGTGKVFLVGAGPGDPELLTVKAKRLIGAADIVVHDRLVSDEILELAPPTAARLSVGKQPKQHPVPQDEINRTLIRLARGGLTVIRLKGGDPFIFGRGSEEALELARAGIPFEVVPGITAAQGCAASALVPLTHRGMATSLRFVTGHCRDDEPLEFDWASLADPHTTLVIYMGFAHMAEIAARLIEHGRSPETPVAAVSNGTRTNEKRILSNLAQISRDVVEAGMSNPVAFFVGEAAGIDLAVHMPPAPHVRLVAQHQDAVNG